MIDLLKAKAVHFYVDQTGKTWLNVDGECVLRIGEVTDVVIDLHHTNQQYTLHHERGMRLQPKRRVLDEEDGDRDKDDGA